MLNDRTILITGATSGLGKAIATALAHNNNKIILLARNPEKVELTKKKIQEKTGNSQIKTIICDLSSLKQVKQAAEQIKETDIIINNAGGVYSKRKLTEDSLELTFQVNYLSHFLLTNSIKVNEQVINSSSVAHRWTKIHFNDIHSEKYLSYLVYGQSKLANVLFTYEFARRHPELQVKCFDPGYVKTSVGNNGYVAIIMRLIRPFFKDVNQAAKDLEDILSDNNTAVYYRGNLAVKSSKESYNHETAKKLWKISEKLSNI